MDPARIAELLEPFLGPSPEVATDGTEIFGHSAAASSVPEYARLSPAQLDRISMYIDLLLRWNSRINLTSIRQSEEIVTRHFGESLFAARRLFPAPIRVNGSGEPGSDKMRVIDVGSGAGFPGLPIKMWAPRIHLTLIESNHKKVTFLREVIRNLILMDVDVVAGRADAFPIVQGKADVVTLRAVERFDSILPISARLVAPHGRLAILIGEIQIARVGRLLPGFRWDDPARLPLSSRRVLIIGRQESR